MATVKSDVTGSDLMSALRAAADLAATLDELLAGDANPVVIPRQALAPVQAALDAWHATGGTFITAEELPAAEAGPTVELEPGACTCGNLEGGAHAIARCPVHGIERDDDDPTGPLERPFAREDVPAESPTERRRRELRA